MLSDWSTRSRRSCSSRDPRTRVEKVAPWLTAGRRPVPGRRRRPGASGSSTATRRPTRTRTPRGPRSTTPRATRSRRPPPASPRCPRDDINYIRNSVKATVDAYDGTVTLYAWDDDRPGAARPGARPSPASVQPKCGLPRSCCEHFRYPEDLFKVQRKILLRATTCTDPDNFYNGQDFWSIPDDPTKRAVAAAAAVLPDAADARADAPTFSLTTTFAPQKPSDTGGVHGGELRAGHGLRHDPGAATAAEHDDPRSGAGAEQLRDRPRGRRSN